MPSCPRTYPSPGRLTRRVVRGGGVSPPPLVDAGGRADRCVHRQVRDGNPEVGAPETPLRSRVRCHGRSGSPRRRTSNGLPETPLPAVAVRACPEPPAIGHEAGRAVPVGAEDANPRAAVALQDLAVRVPEAAAVADGDD